MSSVLRRIAQIPARIPYLLVTGTFDTTEAPVALVDAPALDLSGATTIASLNTFVNVADMGAVFTQMTTSYSGRLLKDLGQEIIIVNDAGLHVARYRHALLLNGAASEGVDGVPGTSFLVRVWAADGTNVEVARTG
jgi:hypothetical protein